MVECFLVGNDSTKKQILYPYLKRFIENAL